MQAEAVLDKVVIVLRSFALGVGAWLLPIAAVLLVGAASSEWSSGMGPVIAGAAGVLLMEVAAGWVVAGIGMRCRMPTIVGIAGIVGAACIVVPMLVTSIPQSGPTGPDDLSYLHWMLISTGFPVGFAFFVGYWMTLRALRGDPYNGSHWWPGDIRWIDDDRPDER